MVLIETLANAALNRDNLKLRSLAQEFLRQEPNLAKVQVPQIQDSRVRIASAALMELFSLRTHQHPPSWTAGIGSLPEPFFLVAAADHMKRLRTLCEEEAPEPLRRHGFYAPPNFLDFA